MNTVKCPHCEKAIEVEGLFDGDEFDVDCPHCEKEIEVHVEWEPSFSAKIITYDKCDKCCREDVRDIHKKGGTFPWPKVREGEPEYNKLCGACFTNATIQDLVEEGVLNGTAITPETKE